MPSSETDTVTPHIFLFRYSHTHYFSFIGQIWERTSSYKMSANICETSAFIFLYCWPVDLSHNWLTLPCHIAQHIVAWQSLSCLSHSRYTSHTSSIMWRFTLGRAEEYRWWSELYNWTVLFGVSNLSLIITLLDERDLERAWVWSFGVEKGSKQPIILRAVCHPSLGAGCETKS